MNPGKNRRPVQRRRDESSKTKGRPTFPKWLLVMGGTGALIVLNLLLFHRELRVAFQETQHPSSTSALANRPASGTSSNNIGAGTPAVVTDTDRERALTLFTEGTKLLEQKKIEEAIRAFEASVKLDPESEDTHYNLGFAFSKLGRTEEAIREYKESLRLLPDYAEAHNNLGNLLKTQGKLEEAIDHFNAALKIIPDHASAHNNLGVALAQQGKVSEATLHFAKAVELQPDYPDAHYNLGSTYVNGGRLDEAVVEFSKALRLKPDFTAAAQALMKAQHTRALQERSK